MNIDLYKKILLSYQDVIKNSHLVLSEKRLQKLLLEANEKSISDKISNYNFICCKEPLEIGDIPNGVVELRFSDNFNFELKENIIPNTVTHLYLGLKYNHPLKPGVIPSSVKYLYFGFYFNQKLKMGDIPNTVKTVGLGGHYNHPLEKGIIPEGVENLYIGSSFNQYIKIGDIPQSIKRIDFNGCKKASFEIGSIPYGVEKLHFVNCDLLKNKTFSFNLIPNSVTELYLGNIHTEKLDISKLPNSIKTLTYRFADGFSRESKNEKNNSSIETLYFDVYFNQKLYKNDLPQNVVYLYFGYDYNQSFENGVIPDSVKYLTFGKCFNQPLNDDNLPKNLLVLNLDHNYDLNLLSIKRDIIIYIEIENNNGYYIFNINNKKHKIGINSYHKLVLDLYIKNNLNDDKLLGRLIKTELNNKVFSNKRILKICDKYNTSFDESLKIY